MTAITSLEQKSLAVTTERAASVSCPDLVGSEIYAYCLALFNIAAVNNGFTADDIPCVSVKGTDRDFIEKANPGVIDKARMLLELIIVRDGSLQVNLLCFESYVHCAVFKLSFIHGVIDFLYFFYIIFLPFRVRFHNKYVNIQRTICHNVYLYSEVARTWWEGQEAKRK